MCTNLFHFLKFANFAYFNGLTGYSNNYLKCRIFRRINKVTFWSLCSVEFGPKAFASLLLHFRLLTWICLLSTGVSQIFASFWCNVCGKKFIYSSKYVYFMRWCRRPFSEPIMTDTTFYKQNDNNRNNSYSNDNTYTPYP